MRTVYVLANVIKNAVAPMILPLVRGRGSLGMDGSSDAVCASLVAMAPGLARIGFDVVDRDIVELGPGRTPEVAFAFALAGASSVVGLDTKVQVPSDWRDPRRYEDIVAALRGPRLQSFAHALGASSDGVHRDAAHAVNRVGFREYGGRSLPLADASVDLIVSKSVLEHVHPDSVETLTADMRRVLRPDGAMVHLIDLRDHMFIDGDAVAGDWLDALRYPEPLFRAMFSKRSTAINRLRACEWKRLFRDHGFSIAWWEERRYPLDPRFRIDRIRPRWRDLDLEELAVGQIGVALTASRPERS